MGGSMHFVRIAVLVCLASSLLSLPASADSTSPGKTSAFESASITPLTVGGNGSTLATASLLKGKKKTVLAITATLTTDSGANAVLQMLPTVNGFAVEGVRVQQSCAFTLAHCTVTGTWWFDVDASELANPGEVVGVPVDVVLTGGSVAGDDDASATVTLSVQVVKK